MDDIATRARSADNEADFDCATLLRREIRGLEILDREFVIGADAARRAEWIGVDAHGRLHVCVRGTGSDDDVLFSALQACLAAAEIRGPAVRHWPDARIRSDAHPVVVLVSDRFSARVLSAISLIQQGTILAFEVRVLETARGREHYVLRRDARFENAAPRSPRDVLATWPEAAREQAQRLSDLVRRIDPEIECRADSNALHWSIGDEDVAELACTDGILKADASGSLEARDVADDASRDAWLEQALSAYVARRRGVASGVRPLDLMQRNSAPLLSAEELAAFRE